MDKKDLFCKTDRNYNEKNLFKTEITSLTSKYNKTNNKFDLNNISNDKEIIKASFISISLQYLSKSKFVK